MAVPPTSGRLFSINPEPITKKGIQKQNPQLGRIFTTGKENRTPHFVAVAEMTEGAALKTLYEKKHHDPDDPRPCGRWIGKVGGNEGLLPIDMRSGIEQKRRTKKEINISAICEKLASDIYQEMGRRIFEVPKTRLSMQPTINEFTLEDFMAQTLVDFNIPNSLRIMSRYVDNYADFEKAKTPCSSGELIDFMQFIALYHRPPDEIVGPNDELVPLHGFMGLLAVGRILADIDVLGCGGKNAGFVFRDGLACTVKIDPGFAFNFNQTGSNKGNWVLNTHRNANENKLEDIRDLQIGTGPTAKNVIIEWKELTENQKDEFLAALFNCGRYLRSEKVLHFLFYRDGRFTHSDIEQIPEEVAQSKVDEMSNWMRWQLGVYPDESTDSQLGIYQNDLTRFCNRHPEQVLKAHYVDNCGELPLPMSNETFPAGDLFTQLVIVAGDEQETRELETLSIELPEIDSLRETLEHMQQVNNPLSIESLFDSTETGPPPKKVLLIGRAGVGKSTLCQKIAHDWASGKEWRKSHAIYWIPLRDVNNKDYLLRQETPDRFLAAVVAELLLKDPRATDGVLRQIQEQRQEILVIFDGYDEATEELCKTIDPLLADPELHILLTSRPGVTGHLHSNMDRLVENMGFSDREVESYVGQFFTRQEETAEAKQRAQKFLKAIKGDLNLSVISHIPLQLQMLCCLWEQEAEENGFANSIISLYHDMVDQLFCWQCEKQGRSPQDVRPEVKEKLFSLLGHIAYQGLASGKLLFPKAMIENILQEENISEKQLLDTGLLKVVGEGEGRYYYFLHLTFQEYLIAFAISRSTTNQRNRFILENRYKPQYQLVMIFLAGLVHQRDGSFAKREVRGFFEKLHEEAEEVSMEQRLELTLNCLKECPDYSGPVSSEFESLIKGDLSIFDKRLSGKQTPFFFAAAEGNVPGMQWLHRLDPTLCSKIVGSRNTPFHEVARRGHTDAMKLLYSWDPTPCSKPDEYGRTPFHTAASHGHTEAMELLHSWDPTLCSKPDICGETPFHRAARGGHIEAMKLLHSWDPTLCSKPGSSGRTPFHWAAFEGQIEAMKLLHSWNPNLCSKPDNDGQTPFYGTVFHGYIETIKLLHSWDPTLCSKPNKKGETPFHRSAKWEQLGVMKLLHSWDPNLCSKPDKYGNTPFHWAAEGGSTEAMKLLHSWDPTLCCKPDNDGETPFHWAAGSGQTKAMKLLHSWDPTLCSKSDNDGKTPFHRAAYSGHTEAMKLLHSWDPTLCSKPNKKGETPFHSTARYGHIEAMEWFLEKEPLLFSRMDKRSKRLLKQDASDRAKDWMLKKDPTFFDGGCVIS